MPAVKSALHRARARLARHYQADEACDLAPGALDERLRPLLEQYVQAWETADVDRLLRLLKADASFSMPPIPAWYRGREVIGRLVAATVFSGQAHGRWRLRPLRASSRPAFGLYRLDEGGVHRAYGVQVVTFGGTRMREIADLTACLNPALAPIFGMPAVWPAEWNHRRGR